MAFSLWGLIKGILVQDESDRSKQLSVEINPSATTNTKTTLEASQTANRTVTLPDATDTLVGKATSDVLENKTMDFTAATGNNSLSADAGDVSYNDAANGLYTFGNDVQSAIDAVKTQLDGQNEASEIAYDNTTSGLTATNVQAAVDEVEGRVDTIESDYANKTLSNLTSPTAINQDLLPDGDTTRALGSDSARYSSVSTIAVDSGASDLNVTSDNQATTVNSGQITLQTGNTVDGNAGSINLTTGTASGTGGDGSINLTSDVTGFVSSTGNDLAVLWDNGSKILSTNLNPAGFSWFVNVPSGDGSNAPGSYNLGTGDGTANNDNGGQINITSGTGHGTGSGGQISITPGNGGASDGSGGSLFLQSGTGGATNGNGGNVNITAGNGSGSGAKGNLVVDVNVSQIQADANQFIDTSGRVAVQINTSGTPLIHADDSQGTNNARGLQIRAGNQGGTNENGETLSLNGGVADGTGTGGNVNIQAGDASGAGTGGNINLTAGVTTGGSDGGIELTAQNIVNINAGVFNIKDPSSTPNIEINPANRKIGGLDAFGDDSALDLTISGGSGFGGNDSGKDLNLNGGTASGTGSAGNVVITAPAAPGVGTDGIVDIRSAIVEIGQTDGDQLQQEYIHSISLGSNETDQTITELLIDGSVYHSMIIEYQLTEANSGDSRVGVLHITTDGSNVAISDTGSETASTGITFTSTNVGNNFRVLYSSGANGATMRCFVKRFKA